MLKKLHEAQKGISTRVTALSDSAEKFAFLPRQGWTQHDAVVQKSVVAQTTALECAKRIDAQLREIACSGSSCSARGTSTRCVSLRFATADRN